VIAQTVSYCPHCAKPLVVERHETDDGELVYGRAAGATTEHVTVHAIDGSKRCYDRPKGAVDSASEVQS
jgi:hypothetical protein